MPSFALVLLAACVVLAAAAHADTLRIMQPEPPRSMDPANQTASFTAAILDPMYDALVRLHPDGSVTPDLATGWSTSVDGRIWRFTLRRGVRFHDGTTLDTTGAAVSFQRMLDTSLGLAASGPFRAIVASVDAQGSDVVFHLRARFGDFLRLVAGGKIVSPAAARAGTLGRVADGTGPYRLVRWDPSADVEEARFPGYWGQPGGAERLVWTWSSEASVVNMALRSGDIDVAGPFPPLFAGAVASDPDFRLVTAPGAAVFFVALDTLLPPLDVSAVRHALSFATDRAALVAGLLHGFGRPACAPSPPAEIGCGTTLPLLAFDPAQARALLARAGIGNGFDMTIAVMDPEEPIAEALQGMWARIGVHLHIRTMESGVWTDAAFADAADKRRAGTDAALTSWAAPFEPDMQLRPLYESGDAAPHGANLGFFADPAVDRGIEEAAGTIDAAQEEALYADVERRILHAMPTIPLYTPEDLLAARRSVAGLELMPGGEIVARNAHLGAEP